MVKKVSHKAGINWEYFYSPMTGCYSIAGLTTALNSPVPIYTPGWREAPREENVLPKNTTQCLRRGFDPEALAPENVCARIY